MTDWGEHHLPLLVALPSETTPCPAVSWYFLQPVHGPPQRQGTGLPEALKYWGQVDCITAAWEHTTLHLLYSRFWHTSSSMTWGWSFPEPYHKRTSHGMILGEGGEKDVQVPGNVVNPNDVVAQYGRTPCACKNNHRRLKRLPPVG